LGNILRSPRFTLALARAAVLLSVVVFVCVPTLARMGQRLATSTHAPSFRSIDSPPKKLTVAPAAAVISPIPLKGMETVRIATFQPPPSAPPTLSLFLSTPTPLRAPPSALLA
jgi:hypothetical protein